MNNINDESADRQLAERCPECAFDGPIEMVTEFDHSPLPPGDTRTFDELCQIPLTAPAEPPICQRCGQPMPVRVIEVTLHPACRHPDWRKRTGRAVGEDEGDGEVAPLS